MRKPWVRSAASSEADTPGLAETAAIVLTRGKPDRTADLARGVDQTRGDPASAGATPVSPAIVIGTNVNAMPIPVSRNAGNRSGT